MKKLTKKFLALASAAMIVATVIPATACGGKGNTNFQTGDVEVVAYDGSDVTITFYHTMGADLKGILNEYIPKFNEMYPNIKVEHTSYGDYPGLLEQVSTELMTKKAPSLAYCYSDHIARYKIADAVLPLDDYMASELTVTQADGAVKQVGFTETEINDFVPKYLEEGRTLGDGKTYSIPMLKSTEVLYYNKTFFTENDLKVPTTWDEMEKTCEDIMKIAKEKNIKCTPLGYDSEANWFITMTEQLGSPYTSSTKGSYFLFDDEKNYEFVEKFKSWYDKGYVTTEELNGGSYTSDLFKNQDKSKTTSYMSIGSSAGAGYQCPEKVGNAYPFEVGIAMIPQVNPEQPKIISQGPSICLFKKPDQETAAAWLFAKFLTTYTEFLARCSMQNGYTPAIMSIEDDPVYSEEFLDLADGNEFLQATSVKQTIAQRDYYYVSPAFEGSSAARDEVGDLIQRCFKNQPAAGQSMADFIKGQFSLSIKMLEDDYGA